jgi:hypothetical protein
VSDVQRIATELEQTVAALGRELWERDPEWCRDFSDDDIAPGHAWLLLDSPLSDGQTPLWRLQQQRSERAVELLARSEVRAWLLESVPVSPPLIASCPRGGGRARLELPSRPSSELRPGGFAVARSVPLGPARWLLLGPISVVGTAAASDFGALIGSLDAPPGEFWQVHGGVLARTARDASGGSLSAAA